MPSPLPPSGSLPDRLRGALLGLAAGDRNGGPLRMALCLADSLLACRALDTDGLLGRYLAWWRADGVDCGPTADEVFRLLAQGVPAGRAPEEVHRARGGLTAGCNPAHRAIPLALVGFLADEGLPAQAQAESALTHSHPLAGDVSAAVVVLCRALVRGAGWEEAIRCAANGRLPETRSALREAPEGPGDAGGFAPEVLRSAVFFVHRAADFHQALRHALKFAGPANYCPVLAGAIAGARWGASAISPDLLRHPAAVGLLPRVEELADDLARTWEGPFLAARAPRG